MILSVCTLCTGTVLAQDAGTQTDNQSWGISLGGMQQVEGATYVVIGKDSLNLQLGKEDLLTGHSAPTLRFGSATITPVNSLVIFYDSGCSSCENELLTQLQAKYAVLQGQGLRVITIAGDTDEAAYLKSAAPLPWQDKYCDYKGFSSENFVNYQIFGTPTTFVVDKDGIITGRYVLLKDALDVLHIE